MKKRNNKITSSLAKKMPNAKRSLNSYAHSYSDHSSGNVNDGEYSLLNSETPFAIAEAYRSTRTNLRFVSAPDGCNIIATTSSIPREGKTITCMNLAISLAENNHRVLLIDADMRKPQIAAAFGLNKHPGLSDLLAGFVKISQNPELCRQKTHVKNLDVIAAKTPPNPAELLASNKMKVLLEKLSAEYDYIMIDTPPALVVTDALVIKPYVYGYVVVVRSGYSRQEHIKEIVQKFELAEAKICGVILNARRAKGVNYGKYGKYGKYGRYGRYGRYGSYGKYGNYSRYGYNNYGYGNESNDQGQQQ